MFPNTYAPISETELIIIKYNKIFGLIWNNKIDKTVEIRIIFRKKKVNLSLRYIFTVMKKYIIIKYKINKLDILFRNKNKIMRNKKQNKMNL